MSCRHAASRSDCFELRHRNCITCCSTTSLADGTANRINSSARRRQSLEVFGRSDKYGWLTSQLPFSSCSSLLQHFSHHTSTAFRSRKLWLIRQREACFVAFHAIASAVTVEIASARRKQVCVVGSQIVSSKVKWYLREAGRITFGVGGTRHLGVSQSTARDIIVSTTTFQEARDWASPIQGLSAKMLCHVPPCA